MLDFNLSNRISCFPKCSPAFRFQFYLWDGQDGTAWPKYPRFHYSRQAKKNSLKVFEHHWDLQGSAREGFSSCHPWRDNTNFSSSSTICTGFVNPADLWSGDELYQILPTKFSFLVLLSKPIELRTDSTPQHKTLQIPELPLQNKPQNLVFNNLFSSRKKKSLLFSALLWTLNFFYSMCQWCQKLHCPITSKWIFPWH